MVTYRRGSANNSGRIEEAGGKWQKAFVAARERLFHRNEFWFFGLFSIAAEWDKLSHTLS